MSDDLQFEKDVSRESLAGRRVQWLLLSAVGLIALTLAAAHAPSRIKLLGLFAMAYGLCAGAMLAWCAKFVRLTDGWCLAVTALVGILAGQLGLAFESHRLYSESLRKAYRIEEEDIRMQPRPSSANGPRPTQPVAPPEAADVRSDAASPRFESLLGSIEADREQRLAELTTFAAYLERRTSALGLKHPWSMAFWLVELLLSSVAGAWLTYRGTR